MNQIEISVDFESGTKSDTTCKCMENVCAFVSNMAANSGRCQEYLNKSVSLQLKFNKGCKEFNVCFN